MIVVEAGIRSLDRRYEEAAATLGARGFTTFRRVVLPLIAPSLVAGAALTWARKPERAKVLAAYPLSFNWAALT